MKVTIIHEENHGFIGVATTQRAAWRWILEKGWFSAYDDIWIYDQCEYVPACDIIGKPAEEICDDEFIDWLIANIGPQYQTCFTFTIKEVFDVE